ncbi:tandem C2 domains nuclear protein-like isoform X1 [Acipenser oxyrinchus oxyrinchus]|uniref:Tandem C2 domains nuclear protein-like isoform X1 n=1 Tax=Acipenser oxyrinchus oxyrinchus TaxID=40147 RepID=A0AAD8G197_ACIOX|nr:tandem C2 domains nuclear protein-like isoform X1 [Acipenser oxyrinchus oxyrinchus]
MLFPFSPALVIFALRYWLPSFLVLILVTKAMATEFIKNCCKGLLSKEKEAEPEAIKEHVAPPRSRKSLSDTESERSPVGSVYGKKRVGCTEHFLLSRPPLDGRQVPFVVPTLKPSYIQPNSQLNSSYQEGLQGSARSMFNDRKGELSGMSQLGLDPDTVFHPSCMLHDVSPGSARRPPQQVKGLNKHGSGRGNGPFCCPLKKNKKTTQCFTLTFTSYFHCNTVKNRDYMIT